MSCPERQLLGPLLASGAPMNAAARWWVIVPMKDTRRAKSRFGGPRRDRRELAATMARDTLDAIVNASCVAGVLVVGQSKVDITSLRLPGVTVIVRETLGINEAIMAGASTLAAEGHAANLAVLPGDLPYLRPTELDVALAKAADLESACVADRPGTGTTLLTARTRQALRPAYGEDSRRAHRAAGAVEVSMPVWSGLRRDVDGPDDLMIDAHLGHRTRRLLEGRAAHAGQIFAAREA